MPNDITDSVTLPQAGETPPSNEVDHDVASDSLYQDLQHAMDNDPDFSGDGGQQQHQPDQGQQQQFQQQPVQPQPVQQQWQPQPQQHYQPQWQQPQWQQPQQQYYPQQDTSYYRRLLETQPKQEEEEKWFEPPATQAEVQKLVADYYYNDQSGRLVPKPGTPEDVVETVNDWTRYMQQWQDNLVYNPQDAIGKAVQIEAKKIFQEQMRREREVNSAAEIVNRNAEWLYFRDQNGNPMPGQMTPAGQRFFEYVHHYDSLGVKDVYELEKIALRSTYADMLQWQQQQWQQQNATTGQPQQQQQQRPGPSGRGSVPPQRRGRTGNVASQSQPAQGGPQELGDMLSSALAGFSDSDFGV